MENEKRLIYLEDAKDALIGWETDPTDEEIEWTLDQLPKVDAVEVVHGRWKGAGMGDYLCSVCWNVYSGGNRFKYCPGCGAKMDVETE